MANYPILYRYRSTPRARVSQPQSGYSIFDHMQRETSDMFNRAQSLIDQDQAEQSGSFFSPAIDHHETDGELRLSLELPGVKRDDVDVSIENGQIRISGEKKSRYQQEEDGRSSTETRYGRFQRVLPLPEGVNEDAIEATFEDGVLELTLPKTEETQPQSRRIEIGTAHKTLPTQSETASNDSSDSDESQAA
ncbi:MAG: Hsp20/alpha crystallin family protein [Pseudomonadota bacterium]